MLQYVFWGLFAATVIVAVLMLRKAPRRAGALAVPVFMPDIVAPLELYSIAREIAVLRVRRDGLDMQLGVCRQFNLDRNDNGYWDSIRLQWCLLNAVIAGKIRRQTTLLDQMLYARSQTTFCIDHLTEMRWRPDQSAGQWASLNEYRTMLDLIDQKIAVLLGWPSSMAAIEEGNQTVMRIIGRNAVENSHE